MKWVFIRYNNLGDKWFFLVVVLRNGLMDKDKDYYIIC